MLTAGKDTVVGGATGCMEVVTTIFPYTAWRTSFIHSAFENCAATVSGVETAFRSLKKHGELPIKRDRINFIAFGGDGGTYDIGMQSLSGAMERGHSMLYVCYDNEAYMNTGIQRSRATPMGAHTSTAPAGTVRREGPGRKDLTEIMAAHNIPYVAQPLRATGATWPRRWRRRWPRTAPRSSTSCRPAGGVALQPADGIEIAGWPSRPTSGRCTRSRTACTRSTTSPRNARRWRTG